MLKRTSLTKIDTCLSYVIKRTGVETNVKFTVDIPDDTMIDFKEDFKGDYSILEVGDIIGWRTKSSFSLLNTEISSIGGKPVLIKNPVYIHLHLAVIEHIHKQKDKYLITISDCVRNGNANSVPEIRLKLLNIREDKESKETEVRLPDFIISKSKLKQI